MVKKDQMNDHVLQVTWPRQNAQHQLMKIIAFQVIAPRSVTSWIRVHEHNQIFTINQNAMR